MKVHKIKKKNKIYDSTNLIKNVKEYKVYELKNLCKIHRLKCSGRKQEIYNRCTNYLKEKAAVIKIQKFLRRELYRKFIDLHGPAYYNREICINLEDMVTLEKMKDISYNYFFSFMDSKTRKIYGFNIRSLYNFIIRSKTEQIINPYTRQIISREVINDLNKIIKYAKLFNIELNLSVTFETISSNKTVDERVRDLFNNINDLGNYADPNWFLNLNNLQIISFYKELNDIWIYRANLDSNARATICPPYGNIFLNTTIDSIANDTNKEQILGIMEKLVNTSTDDANRALGAIYILIALTIVNTDAAEALPWLYSIIQ